MVVDFLVFFFVNCDIYIKVWILCKIKYYYRFVIDYEWKYVGLLKYIEG